MIILDISIPFTPERDVLNKAKSEGPTTKIISTNYPTDKFKKIYENFGADYFLDKAEDCYEILLVIRRGFNSKVSVCQQKGNSDNVYKESRAAVTSMLSQTKMMNTNEK